jgi:hypothetical protein
MRPFIIKRRSICLGELMMINERMIFTVIVFTRIVGNFYLRMERFQLEEAVLEESLGETPFSSLVAISKKVISITATYMNTI